MAGTRRALGGMVGMVGSDVRMVRMVSVVAEAICGGCSIIFQLMIHACNMLFEYTNYK